MNNRIVFRRFNESDTDELFAIRNHPSVREFMGNTGPLGYKSHLRWVDDHLVRNMDTYLFMIYKNEDIVGFAMLRDISSEDSEIGMFIRDHRKLIGFGVTCMVLFIDEHDSNISSIYVMDFASNEWIDGKDSYYVWTENIQTPMGHGIITSMDIQEAKVLAKEERGK